MKKVFLMAVLLSAGIYSQAQIKYGVKAGANFYKVTGDEDFEASRKTKVGLAGGAFVNFSLSETFSVQPELLYSQEGNKQKEGDESANLKLNYINIPVLLQYNASGFYGETGPQVGFLTSAKIKYEMGGEEETTDVKDAFKSINFSWAVGLGYRLSNGLGIGARYNIGISNIVDAEGASAKSSGFHIGLSYTFGSK